MDRPSPQRHSKRSTGSPLILTAFAGARLVVAGQAFAQAPLIPKQVVGLLDRCRRGVSVSHSVLSLFLTLWRTAKKRPCRNCLQDRSLANRGGEIRSRGEAETFERALARETTRDLLNPIRLAVRALTCIQLHSHAFRRFHVRTNALSPPHFVTATVTVRKRSARRAAADIRASILPGSEEYGRALRPECQRRRPQAHTERHREDLALNPV